MSFNKRKKYSASEKKAFYTGFGVGLTGAGSTTYGLTRRAFNLMSEKERDSYIKGYERGLDNPSVVVGVKKKNKWFS